MPTKKEEDNPEIIEDLGPDTETEEKESFFRLELSTIILGIIILVVSFMFFYLLSVKTGNPLTSAQIVFSIIVAILATMVLRWVKFLMQKNPYLGAIIGILALGASLYALRQKFTGPYTNAFTALISIIVLVYLFINFWKSRKEKVIS